MITRTHFTFFLIILSLGMAACGEQGDTDQMEEPNGTHPSEIAFRLPERDMIPEGICYDPVSETFFLGSIQKHKILRIHMDGSVETFVPPRFEGLWGVIGIRMDVARRVLWANSNQGVQIDESNPDAPKVTGIYKFNVDDGTLINSYLLPKQSEDDLFNDVAVADDGTVYITSYAGGMIYRIDSQTDRLEEFVPMPPDVWNNGIDISPDGKFLFVVGNEHVFRVDIESRDMIQLPIPDGAFVGYGDGLYFYDRSLIAITGWRVDGEVLSRVLRLRLSEEMDEITAIDVLEQNHPLYSAPTTGAIVGDSFYYIATSHLGRFDEDGNLPPLEELSETYILRVRIE